MDRRDLLHAALAGTAAAATPAGARVALAAPTGGGALARLSERLGRLEEDGLDPAAYAPPPAALAAADPRAHEAALRRAASSALSDLLLGRLRTPTGRPDILRDPSAVPLPRWQAELAASPDPAGVLDRAATLHPEAAALKAELARARALAAAGGWRPIPPGGPGGTLEPGADDPRVPLLRERLRAEDASVGEATAAADPGAETLYDAALAEAARRWQSANGLEADGRVGPLTLAALNRPARARVDALRVALDLRRGLAAPPAGRRIEVNIPDHTLAVMDGPRAVLRMAVVVGRPSRATPTMRATLTAVQFNPPWGVPVRNAREDLLPRFRRDPAGMRARGFRLFGSDPETGERTEVDPTTVHWAAIRPETFPFFVRQDAGDASALGRLKFVMPNGDDIFLHDTPDRHHFARAERAFSSGCVRLERPMELLDAALAGTPGWDRARMQRALDSRETRTVAVARTLPVRLHYTTAVVEEGGRVRLRPDLYGLDAAYAREMDRAGGAGRLVASR